MAVKAAELELHKDNIINYLFAHTDVFNKTDPIEVEDLAVGDSDPEAEGYVNFVYRVSQNGKSYIVKQARPYLRISGIVDNLPVVRNYMEYTSYQLRDGLAGGYVPRTYFVDPVNNVFMMEDLLADGMRLMRFQLNEGKEFPHFPKQIGTFMARNHFYTSELFLDKELFREVQIKFANLPMRAVMEDLVLLRHEKPDDTPLNDLGKAVWKNDKIRLGLVEARDILIRKGECLIHGDLHTSNIFIHQDDMRVIDMEYSFIGPFAYDLGYLLANFVSQYAAFTFKPGVSAGKKKSFQAYLLATIEQVYKEYFTCFKECFSKDAKAWYRDTNGYLEDYLFPDILQESLGILAGANIYRIINLTPFADFDCVKDESSVFLGKALSVAIDEYFLLHRKSISTPKMVTDGIRKVHQEFCGAL